MNDDLEFKTVMICFRLKKSEKRLYEKCVELGYADSLSDLLRDATNAHIGKNHEFWDMVEK